MAYAIHQLLHVFQLHDVGLGSGQLPGPKGEVPVAALEAVDQNGQGGAYMNHTG